MTLGSLLVLCLAGCSQKPKCDELGDCGGAVPIGGWALQNNLGSCTEDIDQPPPDPRLVGGDLPAARIPGPEQAESDWCSGLIAGSANILTVEPFAYAESPPIGAASMRYNTDGTYALELVRTGTYRLDFSATCMRQFGVAAGDACTQLQVALVAAADKDAVTAKRPPTYRNITCTATTAEPGCNCFFDLWDEQRSSGVYAQVSSNQILHTPTPSDFTARATYCNQTSKLELTGADEAYLFNQPGLRTLAFGPVNCADAAQGLGEEGVDCGVACGVPCPTCWDGELNQNEEGEDCGAVCGKVCEP